MARLHPAWRLVALIALAVGLAAAATWTGLSPGAVRAYVEGWGVLAPVAYVGLGALLMVALVPLAVVAGGSGLLFGLGVGFPVALSAATIGALITFALARGVTGSAVDHLEGDRVRRARAWIAARGFTAVVIARIVPMPSGVVNYACSLSTLSFGTFIAGSAVGLVPRTLAYAAVGGSLDDPASPQMIAAATFLVGVVVVGAILVQRHRLARRIAANDSR